MYGDWLTRVERREGSSLLNKAERNRSRKILNWEVIESAERPELKMRSSCIIIQVSKEVFEEGNPLKHPGAISILLMEKIRWPDMTSGLLPNWQGQMQS